MKITEENFPEVLKIEVVKGITYLVKLLERGTKSTADVDLKCKFHENFVNNVIANFIVIAYSIDTIPDTIVRKAIFANLIKVATQISSNLERIESNKTLN